MTTPSFNFLVRFQAHTWRYAVNTPVVQIGRGSHNDITLLDEAVAHTHAQLKFDGTTWTLTLLDATVLLNGQPCHASTEIHLGDRLQLGQSELTLLLANNPTDELFETVLDPNMPELTQAEATSEVNVPNTQQARLAIQFNGHIWEMPLKPGANTIGRAADNDIDLDHPKISRHHARIDLAENGSAKLIDLHSGNGTWVNRNKINEYDLQGSETIQIGPALLIYKPAFQPDTLNAPSKRGAPSNSRTRKPIVFIPGFMGSQLWRGDQLIWPDLKLLLTKPEMLMLPEPEPSTVKGLVGDVVVVPGLYKLEQYSQFTDFLKEGLGYEADKDLLEFSYDWRKDLRLAAQQLKAQVDTFRQTQPDPNTKVILIAHSMGCLVTRYFVDVLGGDQMAERLILMGGPHQGTPKIILALLTGKGLLPLNLINDKIRDAVATFPGAYQLLPIYPAVFGPDDTHIDIFTDARWMPEPYRSHIEDARKFRSELSPKARLPTLCIVGYGNKTVVKANVKISADGQWQDATFIEHPDGDATIPVSSALLDGADFHPVQQSHGALFVDNDVKFRLRLELMK